MNSDADDRLRCRQLENLGRLMAGFSHELKNHLAIIKESIGLLDDKLAMGVIEDETVSGKLKKIVLAVERRVALADTMAQHLNSFSHRMDTSFSMFQVNETVVEELSFLNRFARLRNIEIETALKDNLPHIYNNPALFQFVFFELFFHALNRTGSRGKISVSSAHEGQSIQVFLKFSTMENRVDSFGMGTNSELLLFAVEKMGASINTMTSESNHELITLTMKNASTS